MLLIFVCLSVLLVSAFGGTAVTYTDWVQARDALQSIKSEWQANGLTSYMYNVRGSCFCPQCDIAAKYVVIEGRSSTSDGVPVYVGFDEEALAAQDLLTTCGNSQILLPFVDNYNAIEWYFDQAIAWAQQGIDSCSNIPATQDPCLYNTVCGGSVTLAYDDALFFPTQIGLASGTCISDAGRSWYIDCVTPLVTTSNNWSGTVSLTSPVVSSTSCTYANGELWTPPAVGDDCGVPPDDCPALRCACATCADGSGLYGCCSTCSIQDVSGEFQCSGFVDQDTICPIQTTLAPVTTEEYTFCGGFAGIACTENDQVCIDDPRDTCDPLNGGADCAGICVAEGDSCPSIACQTSSWSNTNLALPSLAACALCVDGSGEMYGQCGTCTAEDDGSGELFCSSIIPMERVCPVTTESPTEYEFCGGFAGLRCSDTSQYCVDDPRDDCDPLNGGADCGGICISIGDECSTCDTRFQLGAPCVLCPDGVSVYGNCGTCTYELYANEKGLTEVVCSLLIPQDRVCPDSPVTSVESTEQPMTTEATTNEATEEPGTTEDAEDICELPTVVGPCDAAIPRFSYNAATGECESFTYGGCGGNENNFESIDECLSECDDEPESTEKPNTTGDDEDICELPTVVGPCEAAFPRFSYNAATGECESFTYGGCGGNENNFESIDECLSECGDEPGSTEKPITTGDVDGPGRQSHAPRCGIVAVVCLLSAVFLHI